MKPIFSNLVTTVFNALKSVYIIQYLIYLIFLIPACTDKNNISVIPSIKLIGLSKDTIKQGDLNQDSLFISISFEDGDGDLGWGSASSEKDIFLIDKRTGLVSDQFKIPDIPDANGEAISGILDVRVYTTCCLFTNNIPPCSSPVEFPTNTIRYEIYVKDRSGNESNRLVTNVVTLMCK